MTDSTMTLANWIMNLGMPLKSLDEWCEAVESELAAAAHNNAVLLLMPELMCEQWLAFAPSQIEPAEELAWLADCAEIVLPRLQKAVSAVGIALVTGSMPWRAGAGFYNRSWVLFPDRPAVSHDKLVLTPSEKNPQAWNFQTGGAVSVFQWRGFTLSLLICLDSEMPHISHLLAAQDIDLLLVPSMTETPSGYNRVFGCARARAIELFAAVSVVGCTGSVKGAGVTRSSYTGGSAVFIPCEKALGHSGVIAQSPMLAETDGKGRIDVVADVPLGLIRELRHSRRAEVWPGAWDAGHLAVVRS